MKFHSTISHNDASDVDLEDFISDLKVLQISLLDTLMSTIEILEFVKVVGCYPNVFNCLSYPIDCTNNCSFGGKKFL